MSIDISNNTQVLLIMYKRSNSNKRNVLVLIL